MSDFGPHSTRKMLTRPCQKRGEFSGGQEDGDVGCSASPLRWGSGHGVPLAWGREGFQGT